MKYQGLLVSALALLVVTLDTVCGLSQPTQGQQSATTTNIPAASSISSCPIPETTTALTATSRRNLLGVGLASAGSIFLSANPAFAAAKDPYEADKQKLVAGYKRLNYLLDNWVKETSDCKTKTQYSSASSPCERTPLKVQDYLGYKSIDDPLFRADKTMRRLESLVSTDDSVDYLEAMEKFSEKAEEGSGMAFVSSWGEANPGGGKDRVELFVERAKNDVIDARDALGVILKILKVNV